MAKSKTPPTVKTKPEVAKAPPHPFGRFDTNKKNMLIALEKSMGIVTTASNATNIHRTTHYVWMDNDDDYRKEVEAIQERVLDFAESKLHQLVSANDTTATIFLLKCKGKKRGYIEKIQTEISTGDEPIRINFNDAK